MALRLALLAALALAASARAETYKWVDERGVTNYSNTPPPAGTVKSAVAPVAERISVYEAERAGAGNAAVAQRLQQLEAEWLQRQQLMAYSGAATPRCPSPYYPECNENYRIGNYYGPYIPVLAVRAPFFGRRTGFTQRVRASRALVR
jgi:hypothetical protein